MILTSTPTIQPGFNLSTPSNADFQFINTVGQEVSYHGFNQFRIYTKDTNAFVAFADIPLSVTTTKYKPGPLDNNIAPGTAVAVSSGTSFGLTLLAEIAAALTFF